MFQKIMYQMMIYQNSWKHLMIGFLKGLELRIGDGLVIKSLQPLSWLHTQLKRQ